MTTRPNPAGTATDEQWTFTAAALRWAAPRPSWVRIARQLHDDTTTAEPRPPAYDVARLRQLHRRKPALAREVVRIAGGWSVCPRDDAEFAAVLATWQTGHDPVYLDEGDDVEGHFVSVELLTLGCGADAISIAHCKDCGTPVWTRGLAHRITHEAEATCGWRAIWPHAEAEADTTGAAR